MAVESADASLVRTLLRISATVTSSYVVVLVFVLDKYHDLESAANPRARTYFISGTVLLVAFLVSGVSTIWLLAIQMGLLSTGELLAAYALGASFALLVAGNLFLGVLVIWTDSGTWWRRFVEWGWRKHRRSGISRSWNRFVLLGLAVSVLGLLALLSGGREAALQAVATVILGVGAVAYGVAKRSSLRKISAIDGLVLLGAGAFTISGWVVATYSDWVLFVISASIVVAVVIGQQLAARVAN